MSFIASISDVQTNQSIALNGDSHLRENSVGLQLNIPLFEGFERTYQVRGAQAKFETSKAELSDVEQRISMDLWANYQSLNIETRSLEKTAEWVEQSSQALQVVQGRYRSGVGNMIELLNALTAYATAEQQHINTLNSWQLARLKLAASLGRLGFWASGRSNRAPQNNKQQHTTTRNIQISHTTRVLRWLAIRETYTILPSAKTRS